jgi:hypothetical protein
MEEIGDGEVAARAAMWFQESRTIGSQAAASASAAKTPPMSAA